MTRNMKSVAALAGAGLLLALSGCTQSYGMGPAMRGGDADARAGGGYGMGMGREGMGWGRMGDDGQMGGWDGHGMGWRGMGMMGGGYGLRVPDLTAEQRTKIADIHKELRRKQWALMAQMHEQMHDEGGWRAGRVMPGAAVDAAAERKAYEASAVLHRQMFENALEARQRIDGVLTPRQRELMR